MTRMYRLGKRAVTAAETRQRIVDAARQHLFAIEDGQLNLADVAADAGITRSTIYQQFGSRRELLLAVLNDGLDRARVQRVRKAIQHPDAAEALRGMVRESVRFWAGDYQLFRKMKLLAATDAAVAEVNEVKEGVRAGHIGNLAFRLEQQGRLRDGVSQAHCVAVLNLLTSFETYDQLRTRLRYSLPRTISTLTEMAEAVILPAAGARSQDPAFVPHATRAHSA